MYRLTAVMTSEEIDLRAELNFHILVAHEVLQAAGVYQTYLGDGAEKQMCWKTYTT